MSFGAFAGGFSDGFNNGVRMGKTLREIIKENKMQETLKAAREEAGAAYDAQNTPQEAAKTGMPEQPVAATPATPETPATAPTKAPEASAAPAVPAGNPYDPGDTRTDPKVVPPSVSTKAPAAPASGASAEGNAGEAEARAAMAKPTPQQAAAAGVAPTAATPAPKPEAAAPAGPTAAQPPAQMKADPAARSTYIQKHMATKAQEYFVSIGDMENAERYGKHAETIAGKQAIKAWADAKSAPDIDTRADRFGKYYTDHVNDGVDYAGHKILTKEDGTQVAVVSLKDKKTGKTSEMELTDDKMLQLGDAWNPAAVFKNESARVASASAQKAKVGEEVMKSKLRLGEEKYKADRLDAREGIKANAAADAEVRKGQQSLSEITLRGQIELQNVGEKAKAEVTAKTEALKAAGYTEDQIKPLIPAMVGAGDHKKTTDPTERRALIQSDLSKNDPRWGTKSMDERRKAVDEGMAIVYGDGADKSADPAKPPAAKPAGPVGTHPKYPGRLFEKRADGKLYDIGPDPEYKAPLPPTGAGAGRGNATPQAGGLPPKGGATGSW